jgi:hypothetical protein
MLPSASATFAADIGTVLNSGVPKTTFTNGSSRSDGTAAGADLTDNLGDGVSCKLEECAESPGDSNCDGGAAKIAPGGDFVDNWIFAASA